MRHTRAAVGLLGVLLLMSGLAAFPAAGQTTTPTTEIMVLGETHGTRTVTKDLVAVAKAKGATGCVCPGDFTYGDWDSSPSQWRTMMQPMMGLMMPAQGNHDWPWSDWSSLFPSGKHYYSREVDGVHFIALNTEYSLASGSPQRTWLEGELDRKDPTALKVVFMHRPWWLPEGARHPASEFQSKNGASPSGMSDLMEREGVDMVVSAHEKGYQHSLVDGVHYLVAGGGTYDFYPQGYALPGAVKRLTSNVVSTLEISAGEMTLKSYDRYGGAIEQFTMRGGAGTTTTAPAPTPEPEPSPVPTGATTFTPTGGNEWWAQVKVRADATPKAVDVRVNGGSWKALTLRSWGDWAGSTHAPSGSTVQFRALDAAGQATLSGCYRWTERSAVACATDPTPPPPPPPPTGAFAPTFTPTGANEWWIQAKVTGSPASVSARVDGGSWKALTLRSWGDWAGSTHAPSGSIVQLQARSASGETALSGCYKWTDRAPVACPGTTTATQPTPSEPTPTPSSTYSATFKNVRGNSWWVETEVAASSLATVEARVNGGAWVALAKTSWGSYAKSMAAPAGSVVEFRATSTDGAQVVSAKYAWPPA